MAQSTIPSWDMLDTTYLLMAVRRQFIKALIRRTRFHMPFCWVPVTFLGSIHTAMYGHLQLCGGWNHFGLGVMIAISLSLGLAWRCAPWVSYIPEGKHQSWKRTTWWCVILPNVSLSLPCLDRKRVNHSNRSKWDFSIMRESFLKVSSEICSYKCCQSTVQFLKYNNHSLSSKVSKSKPTSEFGSFY